MKEKTKSRDDAKHKCSKQDLLTSKF